MALIKNKFKPVFKENTSLKNGFRQYQWHFFRICDLSGFQCAEEKQWPAKYYMFENMKLPIKTFIRGRKAVGTEKSHFESRDKKIFAIFGTFGLSKILFHGTKSKTFQIYRPVQVFFY